MPPVTGSTSPKLVVSVSWTLRTLTTYRNVNGKDLFGQNAVHDKPGHLRVGQEVLYCERSPRPAKLTP